MGQAGEGLGGGLTLSLPQGSLLKVVLEDYLRLKKLFAQRMVQKAASCHSSISEVAGRAGSCVPCPSPGGAVSLSLSLTLLLPLSLSVSGAQQPGPKTATGGHPGSQAAGSAVGFLRDGVGTKAVFLRLEEAQKGISEG